MAPALFCWAGIVQNPWRLQEIEKATTSRHYHEFIMCNTMFIQPRTQRSSEQKRRKLGRRRHKRVTVRSLKGHYSVTMWSLLGHWTVTVRSLFGHCSVTVRSLYGHCSVNALSLYGYCSVIVQSVFGHSSVIVWSLFSHCTVIVRSLYNHCSVTVRYSASRTKKPVGKKVDWNPS